MKVAYLLTMFPVVSETFILNEIVEAQRQGVDVRVFSEMRPSIECPHGKLSYLEGRIEYLSRLEGISYIRTAMLHLKYFATKPKNYIRTLLYAYRHRHFAMLWAFRMCVNISEPIRMFKPDIIHTHFASHTARFTMLISMLLGIPYTLTVHGWYDLYKAPPSYMRELVMHSLKTLTVCEYNRKHMEKEYSVPPGRIEVLKCGIDVDSFLPGTCEEKQEGLILSVGRLHYHKAYHHLIEACRILKGRSMDFTCWIIGDGELRSDLQKMIDEKGLNDRVMLLGMKSNEEVGFYLRRAQIFALSSEVEIVPIVFMEAMASCLPVVAPSVFGVPELVEHGKTGLLCRAGDPEALADHLEYLLKNRNAGRKMGEKGREKVNKEHNLPTQVSRLISLWSSGVT